MLSHIFGPLNAGPGRFYPAALCLGAACLVSADPAAAMVINPLFDSSITSSAYASQIETAFNTVASSFDSALASPITVNVGVSWGSVAGQSLPATAVGASSDNAYGYYSYSQIKTALSNTAARNPADTALKAAVASLSLSAPAGTGSYLVASSEAKALGLIPASYGAVDGYIGFAGSASGYTFNPAKGVAAGTYDFEAVAAHEIEEVLGRISGITSSATPTFRTPLDLFRYTSAGVLSDAYTPLAYFSVNGGTTSLGYFNNSTYGGDRSDWLTAGVTNSGADASHAVASDIQDAFISTGQTANLTAADLTVLDVLGYGGSNLGDTAIGTPTLIAVSLDQSVPEPASAAVLLSALAMLTLAVRRRVSR